MKKLIPYILCLMAAMLLFTGCGEPAEPEPETSPEPTETPAPSPEPELPAGDPVTVEGILLESGSLVDNEVLYVKLTELAGALELELSLEEDGSFSFLWNGERIGGKAGSPALYVQDGAIAMQGPVKTYREDVYVPVESLCELLNIGLYYDGEYSHLYCTVSAGEWEIPEGVKVPVFMYHGVSASPWGVKELFVDPSILEEQLKYLVDNGYDPIWFEDLAHVEEYDKPVILTFDDGYRDNYTELFPLLQKYNVKATIFVITGWLGAEKYLTEEQVTEMSQSGLVSIQSHTVSHKDMDTCSAEEQMRQMSESKLTITRLTGKEPIVLCYPRGRASKVTLSLLPDYYSFGIKMNGSVYYTGDDPLLVGRYYVSRSVGVSSLASMLNK